MVIFHNINRKTNMRTKNIFKAIAAGVIFAGFASCESDGVNYPDYDEQTVYFAYQTPIRTMVLGTDDTGSTADNDTRACKIYSTMGGAYSGKKYKVKVDVAVENSLCDNLYFDIACTDPVLPMPASHYQMSSTTIDYKGELQGYVDVQLTDAFFADPKSYQAKYVIPVVMKTQTGADRILAGEYNPGIESGSRFDGDAWFVAPQDYVLYCVRYISKYEGYYLPMGTAITTFGGNRTKSEIKAEDWERIPTGSIIYLKTCGENVVSLDFSTAAGDKTYTATALLTFSGNSCTVTSATEGVKISGSGTFSEKSPTYAWGNLHRKDANDGLKLQLTADWGDVQYSIDYDMAVQRRGAGNTVEEFSVTLKK